MPANPAATLPVLAVLPADHPLASRRHIRQGERFLAAPDAEMPGRNRWITQLCREAGGFKPKFVQEGDSVTHMLSLITGEGAVTLMPAYVRDLPAAGVKMVPIADKSATWEFLVIWQCGNTAPPVQAMIEALTATTGASLGKK